MRDLERLFRSLRGQVLVAHPGLVDPNFRQSVVLLSEHSRDDGAVGVVLNRALPKTLGEMRPQYADTALADVPIFEGGPVQTEGLILAAWRWTDDQTEMKLHFGASPEMVLSLLDEGRDYEVRAFQGHAGWSEGQLEGELAESAWLVTPVTGEILAAGAGTSVWRDNILKLSPELRFLVDAPEDPSVN